MGQSVGALAALTMGAHITVSVSAPKYEQPYIEVSREVAMRPVNAVDEAPSDTPIPAALTGRASVIDGDTIEIHGERIRLHGIDAPESAQRCLLTRPGIANAHRYTVGMLLVTVHQCGQKAALALAGKIGALKVSCQQKHVDRERRAFASCSLGDEDLGAWMVRQGWALAYRKYGGDRYISEEAAAKQEKLGIWAWEFDTPWDWRKGIRSVDVEPLRSVGVNAAQEPRGPQPPEGARP